MKLLSDSHDVYLDGKLQKYVISTKEEGTTGYGTALLLQQDIYELRKDTTATAFIPSDDLSSYCGYATILCRGQIKIVPKEKTTSTNIEWLPKEEGEAPQARVIGKLVLKQVTWTTSPVFSSSDLDTELYFTQVRASAAEDAIVISCVTQLKVSVIELVVSLPAIRFGVNAWSDPNLSVWENLKRCAVDVTIWRGDERVSYHSTEGVMATLQLLCLSSPPVP